MGISRVLITGGTGYVGYWMRQTQPNESIVLYLDHSRFEQEWEQADFGAIVHLAPISPGRVLKYAKRNETRVLFASSGAIYEGTNEYAYNKRAWELQCVHSGVDVVIARLFTFVGARLKNLYAITHFVEAAKMGKPLEVWGDGSTIRSYLYGEDLGRWMWKLLLEGEGIYDVGGSKAYSILEVAMVVSDVTGAKIQLLNDGHPSTHYLPDTARALALGCEETVGLREAVERVIREV